MDQAGGTLFDAAAAQAEAAMAPLAVRMRPRSLDEVVGQDHLLAPGAPLRALVDGAGATSVLLWGPPGTGKTTLAQLTATASRRRFREVSAVTAGVKEVRAVIDDARTALGTTGAATVLFVDEVHRFSKTQQDALLPAVENRWVTLVAATTENPFFSVVGPLLSRSLLLTLHPLTEPDLRVLADRARRDPRGLGGTVEFGDGVLDHLLRLAGGDARRLLTALEAGAVAAGAAGAVGEPGSGAGDGPRPVVLDVATLERAVDRAAVRYDRDGDQHYDVVSAFIKSVRGGDADAALHYLARMLESGEDPRFVARRLLVLASEDIGLADPAALPQAAAAAQTLEMVGLPEARLALAQATVYLALAPKSNAVIAAYDSAAGDIRRGLAGRVPAHLRDSHYRGATVLGHGSAGGYRYPHDFPGHVVSQQYPPDALVGRDYYQPSGSGAEARAAERLHRLRGIVRGHSTAGGAGAMAAADAGTGAAPGAETASAPRAAAQDIAPRDAVARDAVAPAGADVTGSGAAARSGAGEHGSVPERSVPDGDGAPPPDGSPAFRPRCRPALPSPAERAALGDPAGA